MVCSFHFKRKAKAYYVCHRSPLPGLPLINYILVFFISIIGSVSLNNYHIKLPNSSRGYISFSDISPMEIGFTLCFWIKTKFDGFFTEYKVISSEDEEAAIGFYFHKHTLEILLNRKQRYYTPSVSGLSREFQYFVFSSATTMIQYLSVYLKTHYPSGRT